MHKPFDITLKELIELRPEDWLAFAGLARAPATVIDADLAIVALEADKVVRVANKKPCLLHIENQTSYDADMGERLLEYNVLLRRRHKLPVRSIVMLLRPEADGTAMTGKIQYEYPDDDIYLTFSYRVVRVWERSVEEIMAGGISLLPLATLAKDAKANLPQLVQRIDAQAKQELPIGQAKQMQAQTFVLMGLLYDAATISHAFRGITGMRDSITYQMILREGREEGIEKGREEGVEIGREEEIRRVLLRLGNKRLGPPSEATTASLEIIYALEKLEALTERLLEVETWDELLAADA